MTNIAELIRSRATQISEIRRTGRQDLASNLLRDLFLIAEGVEMDTPAHEIAQSLSDSLSVTAPAPAPDVSALPYLATFQGQAWVRDVATDVDDAQFSYAVSEAEVEAAGALIYFDPDRLDALQTAAAAPAQARNWKGPFDVTLARRAYRIESDHAGSVPLYADTIEDVRAILLDLFETDASDHDQTIAQPLVYEIGTLTEQHLDAAGSVARFEGVGISQAVRAQVQDLQLLADAEAA